MDKITQVLLEINLVKEKFQKIQENPALYGSENGFSSDELKLLDKLICLVGEINIATDAIIKRASS